MSTQQVITESGLNVAVIIPCYKESQTIASVIKEIPEYVKNIIVVDDHCPEESGKIAESLSDERVMVLRHDKNRGVGGAMKSGYGKAMELGCDIMVKVDGDGQMDITYLDALLDPVIRKEADYAKGNRFHDFLELKKMPMIRLIGNSVLSFLAKFASGYWNILDPTNGYTAITREGLVKINLNKLADCFFFELDMLIKLNIANCVVRDVAMPSIYMKGANSSLSITRTLRDFPFKIFNGFIQRVFYRYFVYDFNMASIYLLLGLPLFLVGTIVGIIEWIESIQTGVPRTAGTIMLLALPIILGFQMLLQAVSIDVASVPTKKE